MSASTCAFCLHANPAGAKYCNECASPLSLKPCRACDAVNAKAATACHRCRTALATEPRQAGVSTETLVAQADETLEELRRELAQATSRASSFASAVRDPATPTQASERDESEVSQAPPLPAEVLATHEPEPPLPRGDHFITLNGASPGPPQDDAVPQAVTTGASDAVVLRARRGSPALAVVAIIVLLALPVGFYAWRNPEQLQSWIERLAAMMPSASDERPAGETPATEAAPVAAPAVSTPPVEPSAGTGVPSEPAAPAATGEARTGDAATAPPPVVPSETVAPAPTAQLPLEPAAAAAAAAAAPAAKSTTSPRPRASTSKSRSRERAQRQRSPSTSAQSKRPAPPVEPVPEPAQ